MSAPTGRDRPVTVLRKERVADGYGGHDESLVEYFEDWAAVRYQRGAERVDAGALTGQASYKLRLTATPVSEQITTDDVLRFDDTGERMNIREVDSISDRASIWLVVESGVAEAAPREAAT